MPTFFSPDGNPEVWEEMPEGYFTEEAWHTAHPPPEPPEPPPPTPEMLERAAAMNFLFGIVEGYNEL
jgi:hypothetical protein